MKKAIIGLMISMTIAVRRSIMKQLIITLSILGVMGLALLGCQNPNEPLADDGQTQTNMVIVTNYVDATNYIVVTNYYSEEQITNYWVTNATPPVQVNDACYFYYAFVSNQPSQIFVYDQYGWLIGLHQYNLVTGQIFEFYSWLYHYDIPNDKVDSIAVIREYDGSDATAPRRYTSPVFAQGEHPISSPQTKCPRNGYYLNMNYVFLNLN